MIYDKYKNEGKLVDGEFVPFTKEDILRIERKPLLEAFDIYKANVNYGIFVETEERHKVICNWYQKLLDITTTLDESLLTSYPKELEKYL